MPSKVTRSKLTIRLSDEERAQLDRIAKLMTFQTRAKALRFSIRWMARSIDEPNRSFEVILDWVHFADGVMLSPNQKTHLETLLARTYELFRTTRFRDRPVFRKLCVKHAFSKPMRPWRDEILELAKSESREPALDVLAT